MMKLLSSRDIDARSLIALCALRVKKLDIYAYKKLGDELKSLELLLKPEFYQDLPASLSTLGQALASREFLESCLNDLALWKKRGIGTIALCTPEYPAYLSNIYEPPPLLFYKGELTGFIKQNEGGLNRYFSIVGSRKANSKGCEIARSIATSLADRGLCVVSGLALGVDGAAHQGALLSKSDFPTIAVLGNGLDMIYPTLHEALARDIIARGGLIISQFEPSMKPYPSNFLNRNRIVAGLSQGILVVQATKRSGSLVSARYAMEEGREVFVVPGSISQSLYQGSNTLIRQGATLVSSAEDIINDLPNLSLEEKELVQQEALQLSKAQKEILKLLSREENLHYETLRERTKHSQCFSQDLLELEFNDKIIREPGNYIALKPCS